MSQNYADEFKLRDEIIHVNHAAVAPWPARTVNAVTAFANENANQGSMNYPGWIETESRLRKRLQHLINAPSIDEIALLKSTSEALSVVAYGIDWQPGDSIVTYAGEFPSNRIVWESLKQLGVDVRIAEFNTQQSAEDSLIALVDKTTRLLAVSSVQYATGLRMDLHKLGDFCTTNNILYCVDAIQSIGALAFDVQSINADFVAADGHKWMLGAEGLALFYCKQKHIQQLKLNQYGWHMVENYLDFDSMDQWKPASSARRFECGSPNMQGTVALNASLSLLLDTGMPVVQKRVLENSRYLIDTLSALNGVEVLSNKDEHRLSGIVTFNKQSVSNEDLYNYLKDNHVICAMRGGGIRFSPHFYTQREKLESLVRLVDAI